MNKITMLTFSVPQVKNKKKGKKNMVKYSKNVKKELFDKKIIILDQKAQELFQSKNVQFEVR